MREEQMRSSPGGFEFYIESLGGQAYQIWGMGLPHAGMRSGNNLHGMFPRLLADLMVVFHKFCWAKVLNRVSVMWEFPAVVNILPSRIWTGYFHSAKA